MEVEQRSSVSPYVSSDSKTDIEKWSPTVDEECASRDSSDVLDKELERK